MMKRKSDETQSRVLIERNKIVKIYMYANKTRYPNPCHDYDFLCCNVVNY